VDNGILTVGEVWG